MKRLNLTLVFFFLLILSFADLHAQNENAGTGAGNPWFSSASHSVSLYSFSSNPYNHFTGFKFGDWKFKAYYPDALKEIRNGDARPGKFEESIHAHQCNDKHVAQNYLDTILVGGTAPGNISFKIQFTYVDSFYEQDYHPGFWDLLANYNGKKYQRNNYYRFNFWKKMEGTVFTSTGESFPFSLAVHYYDTLAFRNNYVLAGADTITLKPIVEIKEHNGKADSSWLPSTVGFEFYIRDYYLGNMTRHHGLGDTYYKFWFDQDLDEKYKEAVASMIYLIAGYI